MPTTRTKAGAESSTRSSIALERARAAARAALENSAHDVMILDTRDQTSLFDYFVIATARSGRQLRAIADEIDHVLQNQLGDRRLGTEGYRDSRWIVLDYGDLIIQLFDDKSRDYYRLDDLWADAAKVDISDLMSATK